jgi:transaldolase/glucose-6-phosphate isomerase
MDSSTNPLKGLQQFGQSVWLDFVSRELLRSGRLKSLLAEDGLLGVTSNPSIFEKAIGHGDDYDAQIAQLEATGDLDPGTLFEDLAVKDIQDAADTLRPVYDATRRRDGYIKIPGTRPGLPAIQTMIAEGVNINVTLLFSQEMYAEVAEAYIAGLETFVSRGGDPSKVASVASFFISRIDSLVDDALDARLKSADPQQRAQIERLKGKVAIANAKLVYQLSKRIYSGERWRRLAQLGAQTQRLLWASTGTKNKAYSDTLYVDELVGPDTVNTMPPPTMDAYRDHGKPRASLEEDIAGAEAVMAALPQVGIAFGEVTQKLVDDGVRLFAEAADQLYAAVQHKRRAVLGSKLNDMKPSLPAPLDK